MSNIACDKFLSCLNADLSLETLVKLVTVKDTAGHHYINICYYDCKDCEELEFADDCTSDTSALQLFRNVITEDECGLPAIQFTGNICEACE